MIPLQLTFKGLHSYRDECSIDFSKLTEAGLFGVFGPTGSGKSTILEAITLALYGDNDRMKRDGRAYNQLNLQSDELSIAYEFLAENTGKKYLFRYASKRNKKNFESVNSPDRRAYEWEGGEWMPIGPDEIEKILGLSYDNFKRTMIIPQGKFQEFLSLTGSQRTAMMEELFDLQKYNLSEKTNVLLSRAKEDKVKLDIELSNLAELSREVIVEKEKQLEALRATISRLAIEIEALNAVIAPLREICSGNKALSAFRQQLAEAYKGRSDLEKKKELHASKASEPWADDNNFRTLENEIKDLKGVVAWTKLLEEKQSQVGKLKKYQKELGKINEEKKEKERLIAELKKKRHSLKEKLPDILTLKDTQSKLAVITGLKEELAAKKASLEKIKQEFWTELAKLKAAGLPDFDSIQSMDAGLEHIRKLESDNQDQLGDFRKQLDALYTENNQLDVNLRLKTWADDLTEGEKCPLCGAIHHPEKFSAAALEDSRRSMDKRIQSLKDAIEKLAGNEKLAVRILSKAEGVKSSFEKLEGEIQLLDEKKNTEEHAHKAMPFANLTLPEIEEQLKIASDANKQIAGIEKELEEAEKSLENTLGRNRKGEKHVNDVLAAIAKSEGAIETEEKNISDKSLLDQSRSTSEWNQLLNENEYKFNTWQQLLQSWKDEKEQLDSLNSALKGKIASLEDQISAKSTALTGFAEKLMLLWTNTPSLKDLGLNPFFPEMSEEDAADLLDHWELQRKALEKKYHESGSDQKYLASEIEELKIKLEKKTKLLKDQDQLDLRLANLNTLAGLFRGRAFVEFMSHYNLQELCRLANMRFQKLNRNQLLLEIDDKYNFIVRDIVNGGKTRNISTLSGGQLFQASLCLALALSEQIRKSDHQQFFFLDEGFGSQDENALELIMQTLKDLKKEKRIVGLISHVEKMKEDIGVYLNITHDGSNGSSVRGSWK